MRRWCFLLALALIPLGRAHGGARHFTFIYEAPTSPPGSVEVESYFTSRFDQRQFTEEDFRQELEFGVSRHLQLSLYVANWNYVPRGRDSGPHYQSASIEAIYNLTNPVTDPIGLSLYQEIGGGRRAFESESKVILQRNFGPLIVAYNLTLEAEFAEEHLQERNGELSQGLGASYELTPRISAGIELLHEILLPDWRGGDAAHNVFLGPNISCRGTGWFATLTGLLQATNTPGESDYQVRLIVGFNL